jgi:hypothetical protein
MFGGKVEIRKDSYNEWNRRWNTVEAEWDIFPYTHCCIPLSS